MGRTCSRPGCTAPAVVSVGFDAHRQLVWVVPIGQPVERLAGVLCERHADLLTPPRGWWIDDRRSVPVLWRERDASPSPGPATVTPAPASAPAAPPPATGARPRTRAERRRAARAAAKVPDTPAWTDEPLPGTTPAQDAPDAAPPDAAPPDAAPPDAAPPDAAPPDVAWEPAFDDAGDARGQLDADSPLLAKAFRPRTRQR